MFTLPVLLVDRPTNGLRGAYGGEHAGELPWPTTPSGELPSKKRFPYSLSADEHQHESQGVGRDVGVNVTCARRVECQRTAVEVKQRASTSAQVQVEASSEGS